MKFANGDLLRITVGNNELYVNLFSKFHTFPKGWDVRDCGAGNVNLITSMIYDFYKNLCIESLTLHTAVNNL